MNKFLNYLALVSSIGIAGIAAYFSVIGLATIFAGAYLGVVIMTGALEFGKLVTAAYLHIKWDILGKQKYYLAFSVVVLMFITSLGIFGYLAKASSDTSYATQAAQAEADRFTTQIQREENKIETLTVRLDTLGGGQFDITESVSAQEDIRNGAWDRVQGDIDYAQGQIDDIRERYNTSISALDQIVQSYTEQGTVTTGSAFNRDITDNVALGVQVREEQQPERDRLRQDTNEQISLFQDQIDEYREQAQDTIDTSNTEIRRLQNLNNSAQDEVIVKSEEINTEIDEIYDIISGLRDERFVYEQEILGFEKEVGPVKYVAEVIYGQEESVNRIDNAIRWVIFAIIFVFDPLAVLLLISSTGLIAKPMGTKQPPVVENRYVIQVPKDRLPNINKDK
ncbi:uncharacterized protein METZ01_LOCUS150522 [marine metagenome]|uniref:DUF4407 domain-containing protein n=1 Tax=marine metagenome TaxID=408172 RepID=A0A382A7X7_9ZZZZ